MLLICSCNAFSDVEPREFVSPYVGICFSIYAIQLSSETHLPEPTINQFKFFQFTYIYRTIACMHPPHVLIIIIISWTKCTYYVLIFVYMQFLKICLAKSLFKLQNNCYFPTLTDKMKSNLATGSFINLPIATFHWNKQQ